MNKNKSICVYCGSNFGKNPNYEMAAIELGEKMASNEIDLVYGGGKVGLMGALANSVLINGGKVKGVITKKLWDKEVGHNGLSEIHIVETMHERKMMMADLSSGFIAMPGGLGTLDEMFEVLVWTQLGVHNKPCGFLNIDNYFDSLFTFMGNVVENGFLKSEQFGQIMATANVDELLNKILNSKVEYYDKWVTKPR